VVMPVLLYMCCRVSLLSTFDTREAGNWQGTIHLLFKEHDVHNAGYIRGPMLPPSHQPKTLQLTN
jgi:hypothetical protein